MKTPPRVTPPPLPGAGSARAPGPAPRLRELVPRGVGWVLGGLAVTGAAFVLAQAVADDSELAHQLAIFQQRLTVDAAPASVESPATVLSRRYLQALDPALRRRISDQVRDEQRAGKTAEGRSAFVLRRLALYEAALQRSRTVPPGPGTPR